MKTQFSTLLAFALTFFLLLSPLRLDAADSPAANEPPAQPAEPSVTEEMGYGFGSVFANLFYMPVKITYAGLGLITGGLGYVLSAGRGDVANNIIYPAVGGTYVVTPSHLKGEQPVIFIGSAPPEEPQPQQVSMSAATPQP
jgi:hypothetical protein